MELAETTVTVLVVVFDTVATSSAKSRLVDSTGAIPVVAAASSSDAAVAFVIAVTVLVCVVSTTMVTYTELGGPPPMVIGSMAGSMITVAG